jgi:adhesin transport system membrane fusion protein
MKTKNDTQYVNSVSQALLEETPNSTKVILYTISLLIIFFFFWAYFTNVDQLVRGEAKVIPYGQNQKVQNFEGGIVSEILVKEGDLVQKGDALLKIENKQYSSIYEKNVFEIDELKIKEKRLFAEANDKEYILENDEISKKEFTLYLSNKEQLNSKIRVLDEQLVQKIKEKDEVYSKIKYLNNSYSLIEQERNVLEPLSEKGIVSKVELLKLKREANSIKDELEAAKLTLSRLDSIISESKNRINESKQEFKNLAQKELNEITSKLNQSSKQNQGLEDQVKRTLIISPVTGFIKKLNINTIGGSVQPAMDLVEIVPKEESLLIETKIKPEDIAFLKPGLKASIKFTAYDFAIYGSLDGQIEKISPDSTTTEKDETYYYIYIKTDKSYLGKEDKALNIIPGMRGSADIITGQKSVLTYLLKPIIKTKEYAFSEK